MNYTVPSVKENSLCILHTLPFLVFTICRPQGTLNKFSASALTNPLK